MVEPSTTCSDVSTSASLLITTPLPMPKAFSWSGVVGLHDHQRRQYGPVHLRGNGSGRAFSAPSAPPRRPPRTSTDESCLAIRAGGPPERQGEDERDRAEGREGQHGGPAAERAPAPSPRRRPGFRWACFRPRRSRRRLGTVRSNRAGARDLPPSCCSSKRPVNAPESNAVRGIHGPLFQHYHTIVKEV